MDTKNKALVGTYKNNGGEWRPLTWFMQGECPMASPVRTTVAAANIERAARAVLCHGW